MMVIEIIFAMIFPILISPDQDGGVYIRGESREMPRGQWQGGERGDSFGEVTVLRIASVCNHRNDMFRVQTRPFLDPARSFGDPTEPFWDPAISFGDPTEPFWDPAGSFGDP